MCSTSPLRLSGVKARLSGEFSGRLTGFCRMMKICELRRTFTTMAATIRTRTISHIQAISFLQFNDRPAEAGPDFLHFIRVYQSVHRLIMSKRHSGFILTSLKLSIMSVITDQLRMIDKHIRSAALKAGRDPATVHLLAVSKTHPVQAILEAADAGQLAFGENYEQEAIEKIRTIRETRPDLKLEWHFIGPVQSNKTRTIAHYFDWVHSVDREKIARRLSEQRPADRLPLNICLQVNISREASKSGIDPDKIADLAKAVSRMPHLKLRGLMVIPEPQADPERQREPFRALRRLFNQLKKEGYDLDTLSMGMSDDMETAIDEGATTVRIGTAIFGERHYPPAREAAEKQNK